MTSLKSRLLSYLQRNPDRWFPKGELCDTARAAMGQIGETTGRRLRELEEAGLVEVKYEKNHAWYLALPSHEERAKSAVVWFDGLGATKEPNQVSQIA